MQVSINLLRGNAEYIQEVLRQVSQPYTHVSSHILTYPHVWWHMVAYGDVLKRLLDRLNLLSKPTHIILNLLILSLLISNLLTNPSYVQLIQEVLREESLAQRSGGAGGPHQMLCY
jgi:hypothetical protein